MAKGKFRRMDVKRPGIPSNKDYIKMLEYGEWLERALNPELRCWELEELIDEAIEVLNMDYTIPKEHLFRVALKTYANKTPHDVWHQYATNPIVILFLMDFWIVQVGLLPELLKYLQDEKPWFITLFKLQKDTSKLEIVLSQKYKNIKAEFKNVLELAIEKGELHPEKWVKEKGNDLVEFITVSSALEVIKLARAFNLTTKALIFNKEKGKVEFKRKIIKNIKKEGDIIEFENILPPDKTPPFEIFASCIVLEFLRLGGQEYYSFCKGCGRFILSQRKGRRQWCSEKCRLTVFHEERRRAKNGKAE